MELYTKENDIISILARNKVVYGTIHQEMTKQKTFFGIKYGKSPYVYYKVPIFFGNKKFNTLQEATNSVYENAYEGRLRYVIDGYTIYSRPKVAIRKRDGEYVKYFDTDEEKEKFVKNILSDIEMHKIEFDDKY